MTEMTLTKDQQNAYNEFVAFLANPEERTFVIQGYSGTGKSTLVRKLLDDIPQILKTVRLIYPNPKFDPEIKLTATTNKAAENLSRISGTEVSTIHSELKLRVMTDFRTGRTNLISGEPQFELEPSILFIDEASYIDERLMKKIFNHTNMCKRVFIGDPAQLLAVGATTSPVFNAGFKTAKLEQVVRQEEGSSLEKLIHSLRHAVNTGEFGIYPPDGEKIIHCPRPEFEQKILSEFIRKDWEFTDSKVLAWTNKAVIGFNHAIYNHAKGQPDLKVGDYAVVNSYVKAGNCAFKTDQTVLVTKVTPDAIRHGVKGKLFCLDKEITEFFMPDNKDDTKRAHQECVDSNDYEAAKEILESWIDLRAAYSCTINKSQGSTFNEVYIDLDDVAKCRDKNQLARMLYVGISRAKERVILTGDI